MAEVATVAAVAAVLDAASETAAHSSKTPRPSRLTKMEVADGSDFLWFPCLRRRPTQTKCWMLDELGELDQAGLQNEKDVEAVLQFRKRLPQLLRQYREQILYISAPAMGSTPIVSFFGYLVGEKLETASPAVGISSSSKTYAAKVERRLKQARPGGSSDKSFKIVVLREEVKKTSDDEPSEETETTEHSAPGSKRGGRRPTQPRARKSTVSRWKWLASNNPREKTVQSSA